MAEDEDGVSNKKSAQNSNNGGSSQDNEQKRTDLPYFPRLLSPETDEAKCNNSENGDASPAEAKSSSSKSTAATRKEENPFSFRHFLKRDLSLPGTSTYESTGARPKVYASTVQHSPTRPDAARDPQAKEKSAEPRAGDNTSSTSSVEVSHSVVDNNECARNSYADDAEPQPQPYRPAPELGMPSLPDFVQDHILVEQAYLNSNGPISVDLDNLPDFTFNTNYVAGGAGSLGRRYGPAPAPAPLDLPRGAEGAPAPDVALSLDLTESLNPAERRNMSPHSTFPLDLPPNAGAESMRLPDFLPVHPGRTSPEPEPDLQPLLQELERTRSELNSERRHRARLEEELRAARAVPLHTRRRAHAGDEYREQESLDSESTVNQLRIQIRRLKEELAAAQNELRALRHTHAGAAAGLRAAADVAETQLRSVPAMLQEEQAAQNELRHTHAGAAAGLRAAADVAETQLRSVPAMLQEEQAAQNELRHTHAGAAAGLRAAADVAETQLRSVPAMLQEEQAAQNELRHTHAGAAAGLRAAADVAETQLRDLLAGLEQLRSLGHSLDPT